VATTTYAAIRDDQIAAIVAITPTSHSDVKFRCHDYEDTDLREWAPKNPQAAQRVLEINYLFEDESPVSNLDAEPRMVTAEIVVAYRKDKKFGALQRRKLSDAMREDFIAINNAAGVRGYSNIGPDASVISCTPSYEDVTGTSPVAFLVATYVVSYWESVA
jgi:hypothetical protein